jgi:peptidyl-prolyl cis-trans isomerase C
MEINMVNANHILVETLQEAKELKEKIKNYDDFVKAAMEYSKCPSGRNGGGLGDFERGQMVREFENAVYSLNVGEISNPVKTQFGYHLILRNS